MRSLLTLLSLNLKLFSVDLLLIENARPRLMFVCSMLGGTGMSLAVSLLGRVRRASGLLQHADRPRSASCAAPAEPAGQASREAGRGGVIRHKLGVMEGDRGALAAWSAGVRAAGAGGGANRVNTSAVRRVGRRVEMAHQHGGCLSEPTITLAPQL